jgi:hypothetical protein
MGAELRRDAAAFCLDAAADFIAVLETRDPITGRDKREVLGIPKTEPMDLEPAAV